MDLISDIQEREATAPKAPSLPQLKSTATGFPEHKKRTRVSTFKQKRQTLNLEQSWPKVPTPSSKEPASTSSRNAQQSSPSGPNSKSDDRENIDRENNERLANMSQEEIEEAQHELLGNLDPSILQMLLKRANLDEPAGPSPFDQSKSTSQEAPTETNNTQEPPEIRVEDTSVQPSSSTSDSQTSNQKQEDSTKTNQSKRVRWATVEDEEEEQRETKPSTPETETTPPTSSHTHPHTHDDDDAAPSVPPPEHIITPNATEPGSKPHWPQPPQPGDLDPSDPDFLSKLHDKYFPSLPADPSKLAWMAPLPTTNSPADFDSPYHPRQPSFTVSALRFDFRGALLPPRIARAVPPTRGLHHHGEAPEAAGYTVKELARLCRSAVPGQRCVAYQTLGRVLYRLGRGDFGGVGSEDMAVGIWQQVEEGEVMRSLYDEAGTEEGRGHRSARAFAIEAIWLYEKGGWKDKLRKARATDMK